MIITRSGVGERCGSATGLAATADTILKAVGRDGLTTEEKAKANGIWQSGGSHTEFQRPGALIRVIGGCIKGLLIKAV